MKIGMPVLLVISIAIFLTTSPFAMASTAKPAKAGAVRSVFAAKDKEIAALKQQIVVLQANILSLNQKITEIENAQVLAGADAAVTNSGEHVTVSDLTAQRYDGADNLGDTMWLFKVTLTNNSRIAVQAPTVVAKFNDGSIEPLIAYGGSNGDGIIVGTLANVKPLQVLIVRYFYSSHSMDAKTPVSAVLTLGGSHLTIAVTALAPQLVTGN